MASVIVLAALVFAQVESQNPLTSLWVPLIVAVGGIGSLLLVALRYRPETERALYGDAMKMVAELKAQVAQEKARGDHLELRLVEAQADRMELERRVFTLYGRIEDLERRQGGRREGDEGD